MQGCRESDIHPVVGTITENLIEITDKSITKTRIAITDNR